MIKSVFGLIVAAAIGLGVSHQVSAAPTAEFILVPGSPAPSGIPTLSYDLKVSSPTFSWAQAAILINVTTSNGIYQHFAGSIDPPTQEAIDNAADVVYDTYVKGWKLLGDGTGQPASSLGGWNVNGEVVPAAFSAQQISRQWFTGDGNDTNAIPNGVLGRFTFRSNTNGTLKLFLSDSGPAPGNTVVLEGTITNGALTVVPEPGTIVLAGLTIPALAFAIRRRRKTA